MQPGHGRFIPRDGTAPPMGQLMIETAHTDPGEVYCEVLFQCGQGATIERAVTNWTNRYGRRRTAVARARHGGLIDISPNERLQHQHRRVPNL